MDNLDDYRSREYDAQLFGFSVEDFMRAVKIAVKDEVARFTEVMTSAIMKKYSSDDPEIEKIKNITKSLIDQYVCASEKPLDHLQTQLKTILHIPPHVLLPNDAPQRKQYTAEEEREVDEEINDLLKRLRRTKSFDVELQQELKMLKDYLPLLQQQVRTGVTMADMETVLQSLEPAIDRIQDEMEFLKVQSDSSI